MNLTPEDQDRLLAEAERKYYKGVVFKSVVSKKLVQSTGEFEIIQGDLACIMENGSSFWITTNGQWAEIITNEKPVHKMEFKGRGTGKTKEYIEQLKSEITRLETKLTEYQSMDKFTQGFTAACSVLQQLEVGENGTHAGSYAREVLQCNTHTLEGLKKEGVVEYDIQILIPVIKEIERRK